MDPWSYTVSERCTTVIGAHGSLVSWCVMAILIRRCRVRTPDRAKERRVRDAKPAGDLASAQAGVQQTTSLIQVLRVNAVLRERVTTPAALSRLRTVWIWRSCTRAISSWVIPLA